ncbi:fanconi-associated nuclease 1-like [Mya arenaria]|uniref:fanconi-associated nuclease 1-like n=1 Tax=Mya arenaria TaxID=6604 RepID=UPI0022DF50A4|nr:fanconi-associated nuclease 1-like [Mya arenaria]XP_052808473.1 fanconi-associated nuclease 1-like [Mya arenaria]XP_052808474.1 fanconi-associated nuclease 1-like [Mya arenaria]XP_052808475.1 fanconi-associated nuclease 1-like [Mya arenaria]
MSTKDKKNRLSLKKKPPDKGKQSNTIVSMFKSQAVRKPDKGFDVVVLSESDDETENPQASAEHSSPYFKGGSSPHKSSESPDRLSKKLSEKLHAKKQGTCIKQDKTKAPDQDNASDTGSDRDFKLAPKRRKCTSDTVSKIKPSVNQYSLRERKPSPSLNAIRKSKSDHEVLVKSTQNASDSDDDVIVVGVTNKRKNADVAERRLSLKRSKTEGAVSNQNTSSKVDKTLFSSKPVKGSIKIKTEDIPTCKQTSISESVISLCDYELVNNSQKENFSETVSKGTSRNENPTSSSHKQYSGNFLVKMKQDIERHDTRKKEKASRSTKHKKAKIDTKTAPGNESEQVKGSSTEICTVDDKSDNKDEKDQNIESVKGHRSLKEMELGDESQDADVETTEYRVPYYLENFKTILSNVLEDSENSRLFDEQDMAFIDAFNKQEEPAQKLYVRIFCRKLSWLPAGKLVYPEISSDIPALMDWLTEAGLLLNGGHLDDLAVVLNILSAHDLKLLAKSFHINSQGLTKLKIIEMLLKKGQQSSISNMFTGGSSASMEKTIFNRARGYLGKVCRLQGEGRAVFIRAIMLFSLYHTNFDEESAGSGQNQLFQMLMVNIGRVTYPSYTVNRQQSVFRDRAALVRFETALQFELDIQQLTERGRWPAALEVYIQAKAVGEAVQKDNAFLQWDSSLPQFLRLYTAGCVYTRIDNQGVEILQRLKKYREAVELLEHLLEQDVYCEQYRGHWYERLALNLEAHLKSPDKSLDVIERGLAEERVRTGRRYALYERARKLCETPKSKFAGRMKKFTHEPVDPTPEVEIDGMVISDAGQMGMKYQFVMHGDADSTTLCAVEELVLEHYKQKGFPEGLHAEGSIVSNLFALLFWDVMFMPVVDVFHSPYQTCPLDMATRDFYTNRKHAVDERLVWLENASVEVLVEEVGRVWAEQGGKLCAGINWDKFTGPETHQHLVTCMGGKVIAGILGRYVKDPRHTRSGFPDLTLWNTEKKALKICEVKGPNDRLSYKQILWIDFLLKLGVDAEACYVKAVGSKKLKPAARN